MATMEEILTGKAEKPEEAKPEQDVAAESPEEKPEEQGQDDPAVSTGEAESAKGEEEAAPPAAEKTDHTVPLAGYLDEREKRQRLERELADLKKAQEKPKEETPDFFEDPEAALKKRDEDLNQRLLQSKLEISQAMAMQSHGDFDETLKTFNDAMEKDPALMGRGRIIWNDALSQPHPAEFVYQAVKRELALQNAPDPDALRKQIEAEIRAELAKEAEEKEKPASPGSSIPESLAEERSVGSRKSPEWAGPTPLNEIIKSA